MKLAMKTLEELEAAINGAQAAAAMLRQDEISGDEMCLSLLSKTARDFVAVYHNACDEVFKSAEG